jgi:hypothetical protein
MVRACYPIGPRAFKRARKLGARAGLRLHAQEYGRDRHYAEAVDLF